MYKRKLFFFGATTAFLLFVVLISTTISAHLTQEHLKQSNIAQTLLLEHQKVSSISYSLFKQLTDEVIFGKNANQAQMRNKRRMIEESLKSIRQLELEQREALGKRFTPDSIEDTDNLANLIDQIIAEFEEVLKHKASSPLNQQERLRRLLEVTIDNEFHQAINDAISRQSSVVTTLTDRIAVINTAIVWFDFGLGLLSLPLLAYACFWLSNQLYKPLIVLRSATQAVASGKYDQPVAETLDEEFKELSDAINQLARRIQTHESEVEKSRKTLEFKVKQRTSELTRANLQLQNIDARRRQFLADISHELRTPLTIIRGEAQVTLRMKSAAEEDYKETLMTILEQSVNLSRLVDDLLLLARAEMNQLKLEINDEPLTPMLEAEVNKWQKLHQDRLIQLAVVDEFQAVSIKIDKQRIQQVLSILIDNAIKYSRSGEPVRVNVHRHSAYIVISIHDQGDGISATEIENIFERFVRFSKNNDGLGLGLPIAKAIVEAHGGQIQVESVQGAGSVFSIQLPEERIV